MSKVFNYNGNDGFYPRESIYSNPKESNLFLSLGHHVDVLFPLCKRSRVNAPFIFNRVEPKKQTSIEILPDECLFEIFRRLPGSQDKSNSACVSKRWLTLLSDVRKNEFYNIKTTQLEGGSFKNQELESEGHLSRSLEGKKATDIRLAAIAIGTHARGGLGKLSIRGSNSTRGVTNLGLKAISRGCPSLRVLSLWNLSSIGDDGLIEIANECHMLETLDLCQCPTITDKSLIAISKSCLNLSALTIESCSSIGNESLLAIGKNCPNLKFISIKNCPLIGDQGLVGLFSAASHVLQKVKLQSLNISDVSLAVIGHYGKSVTDLVLAYLQSVTERGFWVMGTANGLQMMKSFTVTSCQGITDVSLEAIGKGCPNLKHFHLRKSAVLSDTGLVSFAKSAISLESLNLEECHRITQIGLFGSLIKSTKLKTLGITNCFGIKDVNLGFSYVSPCESLRTLTIKNCPAFGNNGLAILGKLCPQVQNLDLTGLIGITDAGLLPLLESFDSGLVKVNLSNCVNITDTSVSTMATLHGCTLDVINVNGCKKITDASVFAIAENCFILNELDLSKCGITDYGIKLLSSANQFNLQILSVSGCSLITDQSLPFFGLLNDTILGLNIQNCTGIEGNKIGKLGEHLWKCDILS